MDADKLYVDSLQALWEIDFGEESHSTLPLLNFEPAGRARTLLCHDMKGGYLEQEREQGIALPSESIYLFMHWWNIDIFNYFSHHMVTIPPIGWTNAAHKHDTQILGTFITEFDQGVEHCKKLLEDKQSVDRTVSKLVEAGKWQERSSRVTIVDSAKTFGFDGWLVNIENKVEQQHLDNLKYFLVELRRKMHEAIGQRAMVVWYDSVTVNGELKWQDALNEENRDWFDCVDAIYLNYCWDEEKLAKSREVAGDRLHDVFAGVDCFGRGCYGGGQWNCRLALKAIQNEDLSCALFAPGWIAECFPKRCIVQQSLKFWNPLSGYVPCRSISAREFSTRFRTGMSSERFCLADIDIQPVFITELGQVNPFEPHEEGLEIQPGTHKLFRFKNFPVNARISFTTSDGAVSLKLPEGFEMEEVSEGEYLVHASSHCCDVRISTKQRCVLTSFSFVPL